MNRMNQSSEPITFVTASADKLTEVIKILHPCFTRQIISIDLDLPELQGSTFEICVAKCRAAFREIQGPCLVDYTSLCFKALKGLPGPYTKWFLEELGPDGLYKLLAGYEDKTAQAVCMFAYHAGVGNEVVVVEGRTDGEIVLPRGFRDSSWDSCFQPVGYTETYAEMPKSEKDKISHRYKALDSLRNYFM